MLSKSVSLATRKFSELSKYLARPYKDRPIEVLPQIMSNDDRLLNLAREYSDSSADLKVNSKNGFLLEPFILGNFDQVRQIGGFNANPLGSKPPSDVIDKMDDPLFFKFLKMVTINMTSNCSPSGISINKISSIGFPDRTNDLNTKTLAIKFFIDNFDEISKSVDDTINQKISIDDWIKSFSFAPISLEGRRSQHTDKISRDGNKFVPRIREVFDWNGKLVKADRYIKNFSDFFRTRSRFVYGATGHLNYGAQFFASALRNHMSSKYEFMFYTGPHNFASKVKDYSYLISADVAAFDQNFDERVSNTIIDNIGCYDDSVKNLMRLMVRMPIIQKNDYVDGRGWKISDDTSLLKLPEVTSNPSGWAWVTEFAKIVGVTLMVCAASKVINIDESNIEDLLLGKLPITFLNTGDDMVFMFSNNLVHAKFKEVNKVMSFYKFKLEQEEVVNYLGMSLTRDSSGTRHLLDIRNIVVKTHVPERSIGSIHRPFFAFGFRNKLDIYSSHPSFNYVYNAWNSLVKKNFSLDILQIVELDRVPSSNNQAFNVADQVFIDNPDSIHYKLNAKDVSPELYNNYYSYIDKVHFVKLNKHLRGAYDI